MQETSPISARKTILSFDRPMVVVGGGVFDANLLGELATLGAALIGADGGADAIDAAGLTPDAVIGDLDSLSDVEAWRRRTQVIGFDEQETTDFEKCLYATRAPVTIALGMTGKRFDHTLAALHAVARYAAQRRIILVDEHDMVLGLAGPFAFEVDPGERVSIHPLAPVTFESSTGLAYPMDGLTLAAGQKTGTSNRATAGRFSLTPDPARSAPYLLILDKRYLEKLMSVLLHASATG